MQKPIAYSVFALLAVIVFGISATAAYSVRTNNAATTLDTSTTTVAPAPVATADEGAATTTTTEVVTPTSGGTVPAQLRDPLRQTKVEGQACGSVDVGGEMLTLRVVNGVTCDEARTIYPQAIAAPFSQPFDNWACAGAVPSESYRRACVQVSAEAFEDQSINITAESVIEAEKSFIFTDY